MMIKIKGGFYVRSWLRLLKFKKQGNAHGLFPCIAVFLILTLFLQKGYGGAWPRQAGEYYAKTSLSYFSANQTFGPKGNTKTNTPSFKDVSLQQYIEYGINSRWTGILSLPLKRLNQNDKTVFGFSDLWVHIKRNLTQTPVVLSLRTGIKIPMGYSSKKLPPLGQDQFDLEGRVQAAKSFYPQPIYTNIEVGYRKRNGVYSDIIPYLWETGIFISQNKLIQVLLDGTENQTNDQASSLSNPPSDPNIFDEEFMKLSLSLTFLKAPVSYDISFGKIISGGNTAVGNTISFGISWKGKFINGS